MTKKPTHMQWCPLDLFKRPPPSSSPQRPFSLSDSCFFRFSKSHKIPDIYLGILVLTRALTNDGFAIPFPSWSPAFSPVALRSIFLQFHHRKMWLQQRNQGFPPEKKRPIYSVVVREQCGCAAIMGQLGT